MRKYFLIHLAVVLLLLIASCNSAPSLVVPESITVVPGDITLKVTKSQQYMAVAEYVDGRTANVTDEVTWSSTDFTVANIDILGLVRTKTEGTTTIAAQLGDLSSSATLTVTETTPEYPIATISTEHYPGASCAVCHTTGFSEAPQFPESHTGYTSPMCTGCHQVEST
jgi:hypothetical protein